MWPASCCGVYGLTLSHGSVPTRGIFRISQTFDRIGIMADNPCNLEALAEVVLGRGFWAYRVPHQNWRCASHLGLVRSRPSEKVDFRDNCKSATSETELKRSGHTI